MGGFYGFKLFLSTTTMLLSVSCLHCFHTVRGPSLIQNSGY
jgi:hypothetical protein